MSCHPAASRREMAHHVLHVALRQHPHVRRAEVADWVRQHHIRMSWHTFGAQLKLCRFRKGLGEDYGARNTSLFKDDEVVHTAQRARASAPYRGDGYVHVLGHRLNEVRRGGFGIVLLAPHNHTGYPVVGL